MLSSVKIGVESIRAVILRLQNMQFLETIDDAFAQINGCMAIYKTSLEI